MRAWFTTLLLGLSFIGAVAQTTAPWGFCLRAVLPEVDVSRLTVAVRHTEMEKDGRRLALQEVDLAGRVAEPIAVGATLRRTRAHGRSTLNRYDADGWRAWGAMCPVMPGDTLAAPGLFVFGEYLHDNADLQVSTTNSSFTASPTVTMLGGQAVMVLVNDQASGHVRAGVYTAELFDNTLATVWLLGSGWEMPIGDTLTAEAALTGFRDNYQGRHYDAELALAMRYALSTNATLSLAGRYYPRGLPLAGTSLSPAAAVGAIYGSSATERFTNEALATLTLTGCLTF